MNIKRAVVHTLIAAALILASWPVMAADEGTVAGIVASKGDNWLGVKSEGQDEPTLYMPYWKGGAPKDGGGFDKDIVAAIKNIAVGSKVKLVYKTDEHPRIVSVEVTAAPEKKPDAEVASAEKHHPEAAEKRAPPPPEKHHHGEREKGFDLLQGNSGTLVGKVSDKPSTERVFWIEVKNMDGEVFRFIPNWHGGNPPEGGPDHDMVKTFGKLKVGDWVRIDWTKDDHLRAIKVQTAPR